jgi:hypothetical protein
LAASVAARGIHMTKTEAIITDIYDAWRAPDLDRLARYLPNDFCHVMHLPVGLYPAGGSRTGKQRVM